MTSGHKTRALMKHRTVRDFLPPAGIILFDDLEIRNTGTAESG
jgi:hypothetical protein